LQYVPLADYELRQLHRWVSDPHYDHRELVPVLRRLWAESIAVLARPGTLLGGAIAHHVHVPLLFLTACLNFHSRNVDPMGHQDFGWSVAPGYITPLSGPSVLPDDGHARERDFIGNVRKALAREAPDVGHTLFPPEQSLFRIAADVRVRLGAAAAKTATASGASSGPSPRPQVSYDARGRMSIEPPLKAIDDALKESLREAVDAWHRSRATPDPDDDRRADFDLIKVVMGIRESLGLGFPAVVERVKRGEIFADLEKAGLIR
jgi:hypothetical protein